MKSPHEDVQPLDLRGLVLAGLMLGFAALFPALWLIVPGLMEYRMFGTVIPFSMPLGVATLFMPLLFAARCVRRDHLVAGNVGVPHHSENGG